MDFYGIGILLRQIGERFGLAAALGCVAAIACAWGGFYIIRNLMEERRDKTRAEATSRESEVQALRQERDKMWGQIVGITSDHIAHLNESLTASSRFNETAIRSLEVLSERMAEALNGIRDGRKENGEGFKQIDGQHDAMAQQLSRIEGRVA